MKNEPWIDSVYKEHLLQNETPLNMDHWIQAEAMIKAQEKKKDRRRFLLWLLIGGFVLGAGLSVYWYVQQTQQNIIQPEPVKSIEVLEPIAQNNLNQNEIRVDQNKGEVSSGGLKDHRLNSSELLLQNIGITTESQSKSYNRKQDKLSDEKLSQTKSPKTSMLENGALVLAAEVEKSPNSNVVDINGTIDSKVQSENLAHGKLNVAKLPDHLLPSLVHSRTVVVNTIESELILIKKERWSESGIRMSFASQSAYSTNKAGIGQLGAEWYVHRSLTRKIFYGMSLGYNSTFNNNHYAQVITAYQFNGFGSSVENYGIKPQWLQMIHGQINIGIKQGGHRLIAGIKPQYLLGARGQVDQIQFKDNLPIKDLTSASVSSLNAGWLQNNTLNTLSWTTTIAYDHQLFRQLGVGIQAEHVLRSPYKPLDNNVRQPVLASWNIGFRLAYLLN